MLKRFLSNTPKFATILTVGFLLTACGAHYGSARIVSFPPGAEVINARDGTVMGNTPLTHRWRHSNERNQNIVLRLRKPGFYEKVDSFWLIMRHKNEDDAAQNPQLVEITMRKIGQ